MHFPTVSVIIVNWNHGQYLQECLEALFAQDYPRFDVLIVDNASQDKSPQWIANHYPEILLHKFPTNRGFSLAFNWGVRQTNSDLVVSLNPDVTVRDGFISGMVNAIHQDDNIGIVAPKLLRFDDPKVIDSTGLFINRYRRPYDRGQGEIDRDQYNTQQEIFGACGAAAMYRRVMLEDIAINGEFFDEDFFAYYEDADLSWRAQSRGWRGIFAPGAVATHIRGWGDTLRKKRAFTLKPPGPRLALCNRYLMICKNDAIGYLLIDSPLILISELPRLLYTALISPSVLLGIIDLARKLPKAFTKRGQIRSRKTRDDTVLRDYFTKRHG